MIDNNKPVKDKYLNETTRNVTEHNVEIKELIKKVDDFEIRLRELESYKNKQEGFLLANRYWISFAVIFAIQIIISILKK